MHHYKVQLKNTKIKIRNHTDWWGKSKSIARLAVHQQHPIHKPSCHENSNTKNQETKGFNDSNMHDFQVIINEGFELWHYTKFWSQTRKSLVLKKLMNWKENVEEDYNSNLDFLHFQFKLLHIKDHLDIDEFEKLKTIIGKLDKRQEFNKRNFKKATRKREWFVWSSTVEKKNCPTCGTYTSIKKQSNSLNMKDKI